MEFIVQKQCWKKYIRYLLTNGDTSILVDIDSKEAFIWELYTVEDMRGKGYAEKVLNVAETIIKDLGYKEAFLEYDKRQSRAFVLKWYYKRGYTLKKQITKSRMLLVKSLI